MPRAGTGPFPRAADPRPGTVSGPMPRAGGGPRADRGARQDRGWPQADWADPVYDAAYDRSYDARDRGYDPRERAYDPRDRAHDGYDQNGYEPSRGGYDGSYASYEPYEPYEAQGPWDGGLPEPDPRLKYREPGPGMPGYRGSREHRYGGDRY
jgi:hypothetical protein